MFKFYCLGFLSKFLSVAACTIIEVLAVHRKHTCTIIYRSLHRHPKGVKGGSKKAKEPRYTEVLRFGGIVVVLWRQGKAVRTNARGKSVA
ncbi:hypothetical protein GDO86_007415 [Hymenochirus boettgeri]|uniref:Secreted protein n=1 Tax=Hymenochirus boettgeri TaxID=247094 RepID=A0A8T2IXM0_9PIPI|nr:hypothetical protein GDO86_007415 [Hymenochirus boettgeri]